MKSARANLTKFAKLFRNEAHLREVLRDLFEKRGAKRVRIEHGRNERGKDIVFYSPGGISDDALYACVVKKGKITGRADSAGGAQTILNQAQAALREPYADRITGKQVRVHTVYVISPHDCTTDAIDSIKTQLHEQAGRVEFHCGSDLFALFQNHWPDFLSPLGAMALDPSQASIPAPAIATPAPTPNPTLPSPEISLPVEPFLILECAHAAQLSKFNVVNDKGGSAFNIALKSTPVTVGPLRMKLDFTSIDLLKPGDSYSLDFELDRWHEPTQQFAGFGLSKSNMSTACWHIEMIIAEASEDTTSDVTFPVSVVWLDSSKRSHSSEWFVDFCRGKLPSVRMA